MKKTHLLYLAAVALFFLYSCGGAPSETASVGGPAAAPSAPSGKDLYSRNCTSCHMAAGDGIADVYPPLANSDFLANKDQVIEQVIKGHTGEMIVNGKKYNNTMPPQQLNDEEIAAVLGYVYTNFGNKGTAPTVDEVKTVRAKLK